MARLRRSSLVGVLVTAVVGGAGMAAVWPAAVTTGPLWALTWQLTVGLGCAVVGRIITVFDGGGRRVTCSSWRR